MKILFLTSAFNGMAQRAWIELDRLNHQVKVHIAHDQEGMIHAVEEYQPDLIVAPYLKKLIPEIIWKNYTCFIIHPGPPGDRGASSLDWAILKEKEVWGVTILQATKHLDAGPVWAYEMFKMRATSKSNLYRHEVTQAAMKSLLEAVLKIESGNYKPIPQEDLHGNHFGHWNRKTNEDDFAFHWSEKSIDIIRKINAADGTPGALCTLYGQQYYAYGASPESKRSVRWGKIVSTKDDSICVSTFDSCVWIKSMRRKERGAIKLPATMALPWEVLENIIESEDGREIQYEESNGVGYLHFDFYNGAMSTLQCRRLHEAFIKAKSQKTKVIVLAGGKDIWSNGIHLHVIEASENPMQEAWENINAIDDLILEIINTDSHYIISALQGNAGAGGVSLALAADKVLTRKGIVFNPHTRNMGLYGSEYWTYLLPRRIGTQRAEMFTEQCLPWGTDIALEVKMIDDVFGDTTDQFIARVRTVAEEIAKLESFPKLLEAKRFKRNRDERYKPLQQYREEELAMMKKNFFEDNWGFAEKRYRFVHHLHGEVDDQSLSEKELFSERRKIWRRRKYEKLHYDES